jgi:hypothetical protein
MTGNILWIRIRIQRKARSGSARKLCGSATMKCNKFKRVKRALPVSQKEGIDMAGPSTLPPDAVITWYRTYLLDVSWKTLRAAFFSVRFLFFITKSRHKHVESTVLFCQKAPDLECSAWPKSGLFPVRQ